MVSNAGGLTAQIWFGVDFTDLSSSETATLYTSGVIWGLFGSFNGKDTADIVTNRGTTAMICWTVGAGALTGQFWAAMAVTG